MRDMPRTAMILAAGRGERMRPLTDTTPKPLLRVHGKPLIEFHIERLVADGVESIVVNVAWLGAMIRAYLGDGSRYGVPIHYSEESPQALETGGGIFRALPHLDRNAFLVVNGDVFTDYPFHALRLEAGRDAHLVMVPNPPQLPRGDFGVAAGLAVPETAERFTFSGIAVYNHEFFAGCSDGAFPLRPLLVRSMLLKRCAAEVYRGRWEDVGTPARLAALNQ